VVRRCCSVVALAASSSSVERLLNAGAQMRMPSQLALPNHRQHLRGRRYQQARSVSVAGMVFAPAPATRSSIIGGWTVCVDHACKASWYQQMPAAELWVCWSKVPVLILKSRDRTAMLACHTVPTRNLRKKDRTSRTNPMRCCDLHAYR
jgi:hypothetical protein